MTKMPLTLWHGLLTVPLGLTEGLLFAAAGETCGRRPWHGQETVPQRAVWLISSERSKFEFRTFW